MFLVLELQTDDNDSIATLSYQCATRDEAESKFHSVLATAAISSVKYHGAMIISHDGIVYDTKTYYHGKEETQETVE